MRAVDDFPLVPVICTDAKLSCGRPSAAVSSMMPSSEGLMPKTSARRSAASASL